MALNPFGKSGKTTTTDKSKKKTTKSKEQQKKDLLDFAKKVTKKGREVNRKASKGQSRGAKALISCIVAVVVIAVLGCGVMYYFDVPPFDVVFSDATEFKYYTFDEVTPPKAQFVSTTPDGEVVIHFIDVGQGDCIFIQFPDGKTMLIDGAENRSALKQSIPEYLLAVTEGDSVNIDYLMLTHCDSDHSGSLGSIIANDKINVKNVHQPRVISKFENDPLQDLVDANPDLYEKVPVITTGVYSSFVEAVYNEIQDGICSADIVYNFEGQTIEGTGWKINIYNPNEQLYAELAGKNPSAQDKNNISPIMVLHFGETQILLTGDADEEAEVNFVENLQENMFNDSFSGDVEVLKVAHHGGKYSTLDAFLAVVKPEYSVISVGPAPNKHGHPTEETLNRLQGINSAIYMTKDSGNIVCTINAEGIIWSFSKESGESAFNGFFGVATLSYYGSFKGLCA